MELLFVILIAAGIGFVLRYTIRGRETHGSLLLAAVAAVATMVIWESLLWLGSVVKVVDLGFGGGWIWFISLTLGGLAAVIVAAVLPKRRRSADRALLTRLSGGRA